MAAQSAAHLTTSSIDKPSIFELVASQSLDSTFYPALKRLAQVSQIFFVYIPMFNFVCFANSCQYLGSVNPERYQLLIKNYDEIFLVLNGAIQHYYLQKHGNKRDYDDLTSY